MPLFLSLLGLAAAQQNVPLPPPPDQRAIQVRPGEGPPGPGRAAPSEMAEPAALAFAGFDADQNGRTDRAEAEAALARSFAAADANGDGQLGYIEYSQWALTWMGSATALPGPFQIDVNGDDRLSRDEFLEAFRRQFARLDRDGNGSLARAELVSVPLPRFERIRERTPPRPLTPRG